MIELHGVSKSFTSGRGRVTALTDISFTVDRGQGILLVGRSGSGKTTLLNCIGSLETPESGAIVIDGCDICRLNQREKSRFRSKTVGFVFQAGNLLPWLSVGENLQLPLELNGIWGKEQHARIDELLAAVNLNGYNDAMPTELSGGEGQRIAFARAIAHRPAILLADEPTAHLDSSNSRKMIEQMYTLCRRQRTTLFIATHDHELLSTSNLVIRLKDGKLEDKR